MFKKPTRLVNKVFIHCSASDRKEHDDIKVIKKWHLERKFNDVGYHFYITKEGIIQKGRSLEINPSAQKGFNVGTIAICVGGLQDFTKVSLDKLKELCTAINVAYDKKITFHGHCEVSDKACPVFDYKRVLGLDAKGNCR